MDFVRTFSMHTAKVAGLDNVKRGSFVVVVEKIDWTWLCSCNFVMSDHWTSTNTLILCQFKPPFDTYERSCSALSLLLAVDTKLPGHPTPKCVHPDWNSHTSDNHSFASEAHDRNSAKYHLAQETSGSLFGVMPPQQFLEGFLLISQYTPVS